MSGIAVLHPHLSSAPALLTGLEAKAATMAPLLLAAAPLDGSQNLLFAFCTKIHQKNIISLAKRELPRPGFGSGPLGRYQCMASSNTHPPGPRVGCALARGRGGSNYRARTGLLLLLGSSLGTAHQRSGRGLWWPSISRRGERALLPQNTHGTLHGSAGEAMKSLEGPLQPAKQRGSE